MSQLIFYYFFTIIFFVLLFHWVSGAPKSIKTSKASLPAFQPKALVSPLGKVLVTTKTNDQTDDDDEAEDDDEEDKAGEEGEVDEPSDILYDDVPASAKKLAIMPGGKSNGLRIRLAHTNKIVMMILLFSMRLF